MNPISSLLLCIGNSEVSIFFFQLVLAQEPYEFKYYCLTPLIQQAWPPPRQMLAEQLNVSRGPFLWETSLTYARARPEEQKHHRGGAGVANLALTHLYPSPSGIFSIKVTLCVAIKHTLAPTWRKSVTLNVFY